MDLKRGLRVANNFEPIEKRKNMDLKRGLWVANDSRPIQQFKEKILTRNMASGFSVEKKMTILISIS